MARTAGDLALAMAVIAGPDGDEAKAYRLALPAPRHARLGDYRVLVVTTHPCCATDDEVKGVVEGAAATMAKAGAKVAHASELPARPRGATREHYLPTLRTSMSRGGPDAARSMPTSG